METKKKISLLAGAFRAAAHLAKMADPGQDNDGGTCNLDSPAFRIKGMRETTIRKAAERAGVRVTDFTWFGGQKWYWLGVPLHGQGNRRSTMSTAASNSLQEFADSNAVSGFMACQYCAMD